MNLSTCSSFVALALCLAASGVSPRAEAQDAPPPRSMEAWPSLRGTLGVGVRATGAPDDNLALLGGLTAGAKLLFPVGRSHHVLLVPDLGFSASAGYGNDDRTLWSVGLSTGFLWGDLGVAWAPRALLGTHDDRAVWGLRNGLRLYLVASLVDVEVAHQFTADGQSDRHELIVSASLDVGLLAGVIHSSLTHHRPPREPPAAVR